MFDVYNKEEEFDIISKKKKVYSVQYKNGYPYFTLYEDGQWITRSAKYYVPVKMEEI